MPESTVELTQELVQIESTSENEQEVLEYAEMFFDEVPVETDLYSFTRSPNGPTLYNLEVGDIERANLLIVAHLDTVEFEADDWTYEPLGGTIEDGRLYGRGAADTKSNAAAAMVALKRAYEEFENPNIALVLESDEELKFRGAKEFLDRYEDRDIDTEFTVMCEPEDLDIIHAHKGLYHSETVIDRTIDKTHASKAQKVENRKVIQPDRHAIQDGISVLTELRTFQEEMMETEPGELGPITFSITMAKGGQSTNTLPQHFTIATDSRVPANYRSEELAQRLERRIRQSVDTIDEDEFTTYAVHEAVNIERENELVQQFKQAAEAAGANPTLKTTDAFTELGLYHDRLGVPGVVFGTAPNETIHNPDEYVKVDSIETVHQTFWNVIQRVAE